MAVKEAVIKTGNKAKNRKREAKQQSERMIKKEREKGGGETRQ